MNRLHSTTLIMCFFLASSFLATSVFAKSKNQYDITNWSEWKQNYDQTITGKSGWLSLAGLYWLTEGKNTLGSAKDNDHQFPAKSPAYLGTIEVIGDQLKFTSMTTETQVNGKHIKTSLLSVSDKTFVTFADFEFYLIKREKGYAVRLIDHSSEKAASFAGTRFVPFNQNWVIPAKLIPHAQPQTLKIPTVYGTIREENSAGWLEFNIDGKKQRLQAVDYGKNYPVYVMLSDLSSGHTTYGAGRYLEVEWPDKNGNTTIDFNRTYNPPCAFTSFATCTLTPRQNRLKISIDSGELDVIKSF